MEGTLWGLQCLELVSKSLSAAQLLQIALWSPASGPLVPCSNVNSSVTRDMAGHSAASRHSQ